MELWLNSPIGYQYAEKVEKNDEANILRFLLMISGGDKETEELVRERSHAERLKMLTDSGFTFDPVWFGYRKLPERPDGQQVSALDDPAYRAKLGIIDRPAF